MEDYEPFKMKAICEVGSTVNWNGHWYVKVGAKSPYRRYYGREKKSRRLTRKANQWIRYSAWLASHFFTPGEVAELQAFYIDGNKNNLDPENFLFVNKDNTRKWRIENNQLVLIFGGRTNWARKYNQCQSCKTTNFKYAASGLCRSCYSKDYNKSYSKLSPSKFSKSSNSLKSSSR